MGRRRGFAPETIRIELSDGDYLIVKKELNAGEYRGVLTGMVREQRFGERAMVASDKVGVSLVLAYLISWSFVGVDDKPIPYSLDIDEDGRVAALNNLDVSSYQEVSNAIERHDEASEQAREARTKNQNGELASSTISPSVGS